MYVEQGMSPLSKKLGQQIFDERLTIVDDATRHGGFNTHPFDDEGTPSQRTEIIKNGHLQSFLHSLKTAKKLSVNKLVNLLKLFADAYYNLGVAFAGHRNDVAAAITYFEKALEAQSDHVLAAHGKKLMEDMQAEHEEN